MLERACYFGGAKARQWIYVDVRITCIFIIIFLLYWRESNFYYILWCHFPQLDFTCWVELAWRRWSRRYENWDGIQPCVTQFLKKRAVCAVCLSPCPVYIGAIVIKNHSTIVIFAQLIKQIINLIAARFGTWRTFCKDNIAVLLRK